MAETKLIPTACHSEGLAEILERVLDKGVVIAGDIKIKLCDIELLSIQIRLLIASVDKAREMGLSWWWQSPQQPLPQSERATAAGLPHRPAQSLPAGCPPGVRQAEPVERIFSQLSRRLREEKGPCDGQSRERPLPAPAAW
jgi:hypothetical protein